MVTALLAATGPAAGEPRLAVGDVELAAVGSYSSGLGEGSAEIVAHDEGGTMFVVNAADASVDVVDISDPSAPERVRRIDLSPFGSSVTSVDIHDGVAVASVVAEEKTEPGRVVFFDQEGQVLGTAPVGSLPDMVTFTPDGELVLVANEGEPSDDYTVDPDGSVSIVKVGSVLARGRRAAGAGAGITRAEGVVAQTAVRTVTFEEFNEGGPRHDEVHDDIRIFGPGASVAQDLEPEYLTVSDDSRTAWVTLQENNALARIDIAAVGVEALLPLGFKDHRLAGNELDASDRDGGVNIAPWPVLGMYQPDAVSSFEQGGQAFLVTANEGDARDYGAFSEEARLNDVVLDPIAFPDATMLQEDENLGRLKTTTATGDADGDGDFEEVHSYGARSFSIWTGDGEQVYDSGDDFERITATGLPAHFNSENDENTFDTRSDDKGPEPEGVTVGEIAGRTYAFVGLERVGGVMVYDVTDPSAPVFQEYVVGRDFTQDPPGPHAGPEGLVFVAAGDSPTGSPLLLVSHEISGTVAVYALR